MSLRLHPDAETLAAHSLGALEDPELEELVTRHLGLCAACRADWEAISGRRFEATAGAPAGRVLRFPTVPRRSLVAAAAAAAVVAAGLGTLGVLRQDGQLETPQLADSRTDPSGAFARSGFEDGVGSWEVFEAE